MYACMYVCMYVCMDMYKYERMHVANQAGHTGKSGMYVCMYVCMYGHVCTWPIRQDIVVNQVCMYACMYVWTCITMSACTHTDESDNELSSAKLAASPKGRRGVGEAETYIHKHTHTHTYTYR